MFELDELPEVLRLLEFFIKVIVYERGQSLGYLGKGFRVHHTIFLGHRDGLLRLLDKVAAELDWVETSSN